MKADSIQHSSLLYYVGRSQLDVTEKCDQSTERQPNTPLALLVSLVKSSTMNAWSNYTIRLHPFQSSCVAICSANIGYTVTPGILLFNTVWMAVTIIGIVLFLVAPFIVGDPFFYSSSALLGVFAWLLVIFYIVRRCWSSSNAPPGLFTAVFLGSSIVSAEIAYFISQYFYYFLFFVVPFSAFSGFSVCYYLGPPRDPKILKLVRWSVQLLGVLLINLATLNTPLVSTFLIAVGIISSALLPGIFYLLLGIGYIIMQKLVFYLRLSICLFQSAVQQVIQVIRHAIHTLAVSVTSFSLSICNEMMQTIVKIVQSSKLKKMNRSNSLQIHRHDQWGARHDHTYAKSASTKTATGCQA